MGSSNVLFEYAYINDEITGKQEGAIQAKMSVSGAKAPGTSE